MPQPVSESSDRLPSEEVQAAPQKSRAPSLLKAAGLIAVVTIFSKLLGAARDWAILYTYGTSLVSDAYNAAFQIPAFAIVLLGGLGGPFHTATVAVFSRLIQDSAPPSLKAKTMASTFLTLTGIVFSVLAVLTYIFAQPIMGAILVKGTPELIDTAARQLQVMSPCILAGGLVGILYGLSNIYHGFFWPSMSPVAMSITILIGLLLFPHDNSGMVLAWSTLAGGMVQVLMQLPEFLKQKFSLKPALKWKTPEIRQAGELLFPATIGTTIGQLVTYVDMFFASGLGLGGWTAVTNANRLVQLPLGVLQTALLVPIFPRFSQAAAAGNDEEIKRNFKVGVVSLWFISMPILVMMLLFTEPIIRIIFQHGQFNARSTELVTEALVFQAFQIIPYFARDSITRVFYAFNDSRTPLIVGLLAIGLKAALNWLLVIQLHLGVGGITFAITIITFFNMTLLGLLSKKHIADLGFREMVAPFLKLLLAGALMAGMMLLTQGPMTMLFTHISGAPLSPFSEAGMIFTEFLLGAGVYLAVALGLKVSEAQYLYDRLLGRFLQRTS